VIPLIPSHPLFSFIFLTDQWGGIIEATPTPHIPCWLASPWLYIFWLTLLRVVRGGEMLEETSGRRCIDLEEEDHGDYRRRKILVMLEDDRGDARGGKY
jgi:hypothetical protein